jgi:Concanavalin A-like lectin/glucanases superfamily
MTVSFSLAQTPAPLLSSTGVVSNGFTFSFPTGSGASYTIQAATNLSNPIWSNVQTVIGTGAMLTVPAEVNEQQQFFRLSTSGVVSTPFGPPHIGPAGSLYAYWNFNDLAVSNAVNAWTDRVSGIVLQNAGVPPTNTALGVLFASGFNPLTNAPLSIGSNFTLWVVLRPNNIFTYPATVFGGSSGAGLMISNGFLYGNWGTTDVLSAQLNHTYPGDTNETFDLIDACGTLYTNGMVCPFGVGQPTDNFPFSSLGGAVGMNNLSGYVQYVGIWTNYQFTADDAAALDVWVNTNGVTNITGGLLAWYRLNEGTGINAADSSGNGYTATFIGLPAWISGFLGGGLAFSGNGQALDAGDIADDLPGFSTSFWITGSDWWDGVIAQELAGSSMLDKASAGYNGQGWGVFADAPWDMKAYVEDANPDPIDPYSVALNWYECPPVQLTGAYWAARWHHVVCNYFYQVPLVDIYLDGVLSTGQNGPAEQMGGAPSSISNTEPLFIGGNNMAQDSSCEMDEIRVYNRPLSAQEIAILYRWRGQP